MNAATLAKKLTTAALKYKTQVVDGSVTVFTVAPKLEWDHSVNFFHVNGHCEAEYNGRKTSVADGISTAKLVG